MARLKHILFVLILCGCALAQKPQPKPQPPLPPKPPTPKPEYHITPEEAKALFRNVQDTLQFVSKDTGLPIERPVAPALADRAQVAAYIQQQEQDDPDKARFERAEVVMKKFGLLPQDFNLDQFFTDVLREQVAGYYDPKTKKIFLLDWLEPDEQKPVMAHELTHALQDQKVDLEKWSRVGTGEQADAQKQVDDDDISTARQAVTEGQGMLVMVDFMLAPLGRSVLTDPQFLDFMKAGASQQMSEYPVLESAPVYLRESLMFPYTFGLDFEAALLQHGGKHEAFAGILANPPTTTREVMEPQTYLNHEHMPELKVPDMAGLLAPKYKRYDVGVMGEFDVYALVKQFATETIAKEMYPAWRGGYYYALAPAGNEKPARADLALVYLSKWATPQQADKFASLYAGTLRKTFKDVQPFESDATTRSWKTNEGAVSIETLGDMVLVLESFDDASAKKVREAVWKANASSK
jgi:hypothetical protein